MIGLTLVLVLAIYIAVATFFYKRVATTSKARILVVAIFALVPLGDELAGRIHFGYLCTKYGGEKIHKPVQNVEGFHMLFGGSGPAADALRNYGYKYIEGKSLRRKLVRYSLDANGQLVEREIDKPMSRYTFYEKKFEYRSPWRMIRYDQTIEDTKTKEQIAVRTRFNFFGGWIKDNLGLIGGGAVSCPRKQMSYKEFFTKTLMPPR